LFTAVLGARYSLPDMFYHYVGCLVSCQISSLHHKTPSMRLYSVIYRVHRLKRNPTTITYGTKMKSEAGLPSWYSSQGYPGWYSTTHASCWLGSLRQTRPAGIPTEWTRTQTTVLGCCSCHHIIARPQVADGRDGLQIWRVAANILTKQSRTTDRVWTSREQTTTRIRVLRELKMDEWMWNEFTWLRTGTNSGLTWTW
jgi:hypothetical protein